MLLHFLLDRVVWPSIPSIAPDLLGLGYSAHHFSGLGEDGMLQGPSKAWQKIVTYEVIF